MSGDRRRPGGPPGPPLPAHLDPRAGRPPRDAAGAVTARPVVTGRRRRRAAVLGRVVAAVLSAALLAGSGWGWYLGQVADATVNRTDAIPAEGNEGNSEAMNLLLVGNDSRSNLTDEQLAELNAGTDSGINTDTIMLVHVPADGSRASFVSFPRDSWVEIPGHGMDKLNAAYAYGYSDAGNSADEAARQAAGAQLLVQTISRLSGLEIDHYAEVDLLGFFELSSVVGGVEVNLCNAVDDREWSGAFFPAGKQTISGADALKFVRQRHNFGPDGRGDFDRIVRQQVFIAGVLRKMLSEDVLFDLGKQRRLVQAAAESLTVDEDLNLLQLAEQMQSVTTGSIEFQTVPNVGVDREDDKSIVRLADEATLERFFAELSSEPEEAAPADAAPPAAADPAEVSVAVFNGSGTSGLAAEAQADLEAGGFSVVSTGNADSSDYARTEIRHAAGDEALAAAVAAAVPGAVTTLVDDATPGTVQLVLGTDFNGIGQPTGAEPPAAPVEGEGARTAADTGCIN